MESNQKPEVFRTNIRLPKDMETWIKRNANQHFRSFNAELVEMVRKAMHDEVTSK